MTPVVVIGASKFALEVTRYINASGEYVVKGYIPVKEEAVEVSGRPLMDLDLNDLEDGSVVAFAVHDPKLREHWLHEVRARQFATPNFVHPDTYGFDELAASGVGNIVGPKLYFGVGAELGSYNIFHYLSSVGNYSTIGDNNFFAPNFHSGNSVVVGSHTSFGMSCTIAPAVSIGDNTAFQAGSVILEDAKPNRVYLPFQRVTALPRAGGIRLADEGGRE